MRWIQNARAWLRQTLRLPQLGRTKLGERGERAAARYLRRKGWTVIGHQVRDRSGEIDLVAVEGRTVVFVEVKTRQSGPAADALSAVNADKQARISRAALRFLRRHQLLECQARFDIIAVIWPADRRRRLEQVRSRLVVRRPGAPRPERYETVWHFRTYSLRQVQTLLRHAREWEHVETYDFEHDVSRRHPLDGERIDVVLILRRR